MPCKAFIVCTTMAHVDTILEDSSWTPPPWGSLSKLYRRVTWTVFVSFVLLLLTLLYWIIPCHLYRRVNRIVYNIIRFITQIRQYFTVYFKPYQTVHYGTILKDALGTISSSVDCITLENSSSWHRPISGKLIHQNFMSTYSVFVKYRSARNSLNNIFRLNAIFGWDFQKSACTLWQGPCPKFQNWRLDEFSKNRA